MSRFVSRFCWFAVVALMLGSALPAWVRAETPASQGGPHAPAVANAPAADQGDHAPVSPVRREAELGIWTIVIFLALLAILSKAAWKPMLKGLQAREETIRTAAEEARKTRDEMERMREQFKKERADATAEIQRTMEESRTNTQRMIDDMRTKAQEEIQGERNRARHELEVARDQALQELWNNAAQLATLISSKAIGRSLSEDDHRRLVDEAVAEISQSNGSAA